MQIQVPVDVCDACRQWLDAHGIDACCDPLPPDLADRIPLVHVQPLGGSRNGVVVDRFGIRLYAHAATYEDAIALALRAAGVIEGMAGHVVDGSQCYSVSITALPYPAFDLEHENIPRACTTGTVVMRAKTIEI